MPDYFYCPPDHIDKESITIEGEEFSHLVHVMRKKTGDEIRIVDGRGTAYDVRLDELRKRTAHGRILAVLPNHHESPADVSIAVGILKNPSKFDFLVEKVTELGVRSIIPLKTDRTIPHHAKIDRWQKLALSAMKQSGRSFLPEVHELTAFNDLVTSNAKYDSKIIAHEREVSTSMKIFPDQQPGGSTLVVVGPEGGFTEEEVTTAMGSGFVPVYLGERRLRTETAAIILAAAISLIGHASTH